MDGNGGVFFSRMNAGLHNSRALTRHLDKTIDQIEYTPNQTIRWIT